ncbi:hypothetical protein P152DRAFT_447091 [Eremomyces bilateralis CBS 781.70]|uniref:Uncharacterized protein n=1 Tax=Eremomyces bilateralis CBS 781.70 TaxID=1392243 RepID=A0A6G1G9N3_9PEZI|nr:uncharacterized protein P152DRAFT_447091 [Eremomyces bilateralis CBS 781.70]KAF1814788.1 hypothetical protein P152DRAFT_447091 [Eremomyces bilateralis CBS 781.70]
MSGASDALKRLLLLSKTTQSLISHFDSGLSTLLSAPTTTHTSASSLIQSTSATSSTPPDPTATLEALCALASHLKSRTSTLILLLLQTAPKDYGSASTLRAITPLLSEIGGKIVPTLVATVTTLANRETNTEWPAVVKKEVVADVAQIIAAVAALVGEVGVAGQGLRDAMDGGIAAVSEAKTMKETKYGQALLAGAGRVWGGVDVVVALKDKDGLARMIAGWIEERREVVADGVSELNGLGTPKEEGDEDFGDEEDELGDFGGEIEEDMREIYDSTMAKLGTLDELFVQLTKKVEGRNISEMAMVNGRHPVDQLLDAAKQIQEAVDDVAAGFYDGDEDGVNVPMTTIRNQVQIIHRVLDAMAHSSQEKANGTTNGTEDKTTDLIRLFEKLLEDLTRCSRLVDRLESNTLHPPIKTPLTASIDTEMVQFRFLAVQLKATLPSRSNPYLYYCPVSVYLQECSSDAGSNCTSSNQLSRHCSTSARGCRSRLSGLRYYGRGGRCNDVDHGRISARYTGLFADVYGSGLDL